MPKPGENNAEVNEINNENGNVINNDNNNVINNANNNESNEEINEVNPEEPENPEEGNNLDESFMSYGVENGMNDSFEVDMADDEEKAAFKWYDNLQKVLDEAGCELDLNVPADTVRLNIFEITKNAPDEYDINMSSAMDPTHQNIDVNTITKEELLKRQKTLLNADSIVRMYEAAKKGLLIVYTHAYAKTQYKQRPVYVDENGLPAVGHDVDHPTEYEGQAMEVLDEPELPEEPSKEVRKLAEAGDRDAKDEIRRYNYKKQNYDKNMPIWNRAMEMKQNDPETYERYYNLSTLQRYYFGAISRPDIDNILEFGAMICGLHREYEREQMTEDVRKAHEYVDDMELNVHESRTYFNNIRETDRKSEPSDEIMEVIASAFVAGDEMARAKTAIAEGKTKDFKPLTEDERKAKINELMNSDDFIRGARQTTGQELYELAGKDPEKYVAAIGKFKTKLYKASQEALDNTLLKPLFEDVDLQAVKSPEEKMWEDLRNTLNEAGYEIDLSSKEDLARLLISDVTKTGRGRADVRMRYATDPEKLPIDVATITEDEIMRRQHPGLPNAEMMQDIINAAKEGRLFVQPHDLQNASMKACQVIMGANGKLRMGPDEDLLEGDQLKAARILAEPERPQNPPTFGDKFLAFFGNSKAKDRIARYEQKMNRYTENLAHWNEVQAMDKDMVKQTHNLLYTTQAFFHDDTGEDTMQYKGMVTKLHRKHEISTMPEEQRYMESDYERHVEYIKGITDNIMEMERAGLMPGNEKISDQLAFYLARLITSRKEIKNIENLRGKDVPEVYLAKSEEQMNAETIEYMKSEEFKGLRENVTNSDLRDAIENVNLGMYKNLRSIDIVPSLQQNNAPQEEQQIKNPVSKQDAQKYKAAAGDITKEFAKCVMDLQRFKESGSIAPNESILKNPEQSALLAKMMVLRVEMVKLKNAEKGFGKDVEISTMNDINKQAEEYKNAQEFLGIANFITGKDLVRIADASANGVNNSMHEVDRVIVDAANRLKANDEVLKEQEQPENEIKAAEHNLNKSKPEKEMERSNSEGNLEEEKELGEQRSYSNMF